MSANRRLATGGRIDRNAPLRFTFNGIAMQGCQGDTLASALLANGASMVARSFKYHRPRGIIAAGPEEPNALVQLGEGDQTVPNLRATQVELFDGLVATSVNCWPSLRFDLGAINGLVARCLPAGFYYKTFMWPANQWPRYEKIIRRAAGLGVAPDAPDPDYYEKVNAHCDVLVVGAGSAGLAAARLAARTGARVIIVDEGNEFGGNLLSSPAATRAAASDWIAASVAELARRSNVRSLTRTTAFGYYDQNFVALAERVTHHRPEGGGTGKLPRERLWRVRARHVVLATGAIERPLVFGANDLPGVMLAGSVSTYINRFGVAPGSRAVVFTNNDTGYQCARDMLDAGITVRSIVDSRDGAATESARVMLGDHYVDVRPRQVIHRAGGRRRVGHVDIAALNDDGTATASQSSREHVDLVAVSGGFSPVVHLHAQSGARPVYDEAIGAFVPGASVQEETTVGAARGLCATGEIVEDAIAATGGVLAGLGYGECAADDINFDDGARASNNVEALWLVPGPGGAEHGKRFVDFQNDTTAADIQLAVREGYRSIEHVKRYTLLGFGTDQGKLGNINGMAIAATALGQSIAETGTTTYRPAYTPVTFGTMVGRAVGSSFDPVRKTAIHPWHVAAGAEFETVGQWLRPWYYPKDGEDMDAAVARECEATRTGVGILDASTLGKIEIHGADAGEFLDRIYTNLFSSLGVGRCRYGLMLGEDGMVMDDGVSTRIADDHYYMTTTTGGAAHVLGWLELWHQTEWPSLKVYFNSVTDHWATIALSGPKARELLQSICPDVDLSDDQFPFMSYVETQIHGVDARLFRISFSGERSYEINVPANHGRAIWDLVIEKGAPYGITPYGTEAMHVLRAEKGFIIVGQDTDGSVTPDDLGMNWIVSKKKDFLGKRSLSRPDCTRRGRKQLVGLVTEHKHEVLPEGAQLVDVLTRTPPVPMIGHVTSSYMSATLGHSIALALIKDGRSRIGDTVHAPLLDGRSLTATIVSPTFYDPEGERQNG